MRKLSTRARWAVPAGVVAAIGVGIAASAVASASEPALPARNAAQLLTEVQQAAARPLGPLTATIQETANLGIPALPQVGGFGGQSGPGSTLSPLAGTTTVNVWYLNQQHVRLAVPTQMGESDVRLAGTKLWLWNSKSQMATHVLLPAAASNAGKGAAPKAGAAIGSPAAAARQLLTAVGPSTSVRVGPNVSVAGRAAYQLEITPKGSGSLVSQILIAIDASSYVPLRLQVYARGSSTPAFQLGFTALTFGAPAASNFTFTPPPGAKVKTVTVPSKLPAGLAKGGPLGLGSLGQGLGALGPASVGIGSVGLGSFSTQAGSSGAYSSNLTIRAPTGHQAYVSVNPGSGQATYISPPAGQQAYVSVNPGSGQATYINPPAPAPAPLPQATAKRLRAAFLAGLPKGLTKAERAAAIKAFGAHIAAGGQLKGGWTSYAPLTGIPSAGPGSGAPKVLGTGWTSVIATPASPAVAAAVQQALTARAVQAPQQSASASAGQGVFSSSASAVPIGPDLAVLRALLRASTPVTKSWGSGRLLQTTLLTVLVTSKGQILAGAVTPAVLYADAAHLSR